MKKKAIIFSVSALIALLFFGLLLYKGVIKKEFPFFGFKEPKRSTSSMKKNQLPDRKNFGSLKKEPSSKKFRYEEILYVEEEVGSYYEMRGNDGCSYQVYEEAEKPAFLEKSKFPAPPMQPFEPISSTNAKELEEMLYMEEAAGYYYEMKGNDGCRYQVYEEKEKPAFLKRPKLAESINSTNAKELKERLLNKKKDQVKVKATYYLPSTFFVLLIFYFSHFGSLASAPSVQERTLFYATLLSIIASCSLSYFINRVFSATYQRLFGMFKLFLLDLFLQLLLFGLLIGRIALKEASTKHFLGSAIAPQMVCYTYLVYFGLLPFFNYLCLLFIRWRVSKATKKLAITALPKNLETTLPSRPINPPFSTPLPLVETK